MEGEDSPLPAGAQSVVVHGGNTAIDVARTAKRPRAEEAVIVIAASREKMAHDFEVEGGLRKAS